MSEVSDQFTAVPARQVSAAVWRNGDDHIFIGAPNFEALRRAWKQITGTDIESAQRLIVVNPDPDVATDTKEGG